MNKFWGRYVQQHKKYETVFYINLDHNVNIFTFLSFGFGVPVGPFHNQTKCKPSSIPKISLASVACLLHEWEKIPLDKK